jgi:hypothetical protein
MVISAIFPSEALGNRAIVTGVRSMKRPSGATLPFGGRSGYGAQTFLRAKEFRG